MAIHTMALVDTTTFKVVHRNILEVRIILYFFVGISYSTVFEYPSYKTFML